MREEGRVEEERKTLL